jgi:dipeptidyl aminopeptidase/acylaminoacyl peptidase
MRAPTSVRTTAAALLLAALPAVPAAAQADVLAPWDVARLESVDEAVASPDGRHVAYTVSIPRNPMMDEDGAAWEELHVAGPDGATRPFVTGEVNVGHLAWTPDGSGVAFLAKRGDDEERALYVIPLAGGEARRVLSHPTAVGDFSFSPDGARVAFVAAEEEPEEKAEAEEKGFKAVVYEEEWHPDRLWIAPLEGGVAGEAKAAELAGSVDSVAWSPAGDRLAVTVAPTPLIDDSYMYRRIKVLDAGSGAITAEIANPGKLGEIEWSPDGRHLAFVSAADVNDPREGRLMAVPAAGGAPRDLVPGFEGHVDEIEWSDADTLLFLASQRVHSWIGSVEVDGSGRRVVLPEGEAVWTSFDRGGDGSLALVGESPSHPRELYRWTPGGGAQRATTRNAWLADKRLAPQEVVTVTARDGLELDGILIRPLDARPGQRHPLILTVHGGPEAHHVDGWMTSYSQPGQVAAARGFAVFYLNYRGSTGRGVEFSKLSQGDPAGAEFRDLVDGVDHLIAAGLVDRDKVGITGGSYGGYATAWGSTYFSERFAAGVMFVGISDLVSKLGTSDIPQELYLVHARRWPWEDWQLMMERSPLHYVEQARTPLLILGGTDDPRVHHSQSLALYRYLKILGNTPVRLVQYPGEEHGNRKAAARLDYHLRMLRWFEHYLQGAGGEPPPPDLDYAEPGTEDEEEEEGAEEPEEPTELDEEHGGG